MVITASYQNINSTFATTTVNTAAAGPTTSTSAIVNSNKTSVLLQLLHQSSGAVCESRGGHPGLPGP